MRCQAVGTNGVPTACLTLSKDAMTAKRRPGQPTKLTPEVRDALVRAVVSGMSFTTAAALVGIDNVTETRWRQRGENALARAAENDEPVTPEDEPFCEYVRAIQRARSDAIQARLANINEAAADGHWQAAAWWLERMVPKDYGRKATVAVTGDDGGPVKVEIDHRRAMLERLGLADDADSAV